MLRRLLITSVAVCSAASPALADDLHYRISGFGTFAATQTDDPGLGFRLANQLKYKANQTSYETDTRVAAQLDINPGGKVYGVVQAMAVNREKGELQPEIEWALLGWNINSDFSLRVGRMVTPVFLQSEVRYVGYALTPVRYSTEMSANYPLSRHDGFNLSWTHSYAVGDLSADVYGGESSYANATTNLDAKHLFGFAFQWAKDNLRLRYAHTELEDVTAGGPGVAALTPLIAGLTNPAIAPLCSGCKTAGDEFARAVNGWSATFDSFGGQYDDGVWQVTAEMGERSTNTYITGVNSWSVLAAYRLGNWMPYAGMSEFATQDHDAPTLVGSGPAAPLAAATNKQYVGQNATREIQTVGARWDFKPGMALKIQVDHLKHIGYQGQPPVAGGVFPVVPGKPYPSSANVYSLALDFVY